MEESTQKFKKFLFQKKYKTINLKIEQFNIFKINLIIYIVFKYVNVRDIFKNLMFLYLVI